MIKASHGAVNSDWCLQVRGLSLLVHRLSLSSNRPAEGGVGSSEKVRLPLVYMHSGRMPQRLCLHSTTRGRVRRPLHCLDDLIAFSCHHNSIASWTSQGPRLAICGVCLAVMHKLNRQSGCIRAVIQRGVDNAS